ncbi:MAG TPA: class I SAM-dependent methyltransferase [Thermoanaerobaculia bacterium]|jgi:SAM-dependent methyltransferase
MVWNKIRHLLPARLKDEAKERVAKIARETWRPLEARTEEIAAALGGRLQGLGNAPEAKDQESKNQNQTVVERFDALNNQVRDLQTLVQQIVSTLGQEDPALVPPPSHLQIRVSGNYVPHFLESGFRVCNDFNAALRVAGKTLADFPRILDFGCGCGRTTRALKLLHPKNEIHGTDIDPEAVAWLQSHYGRLAEFRLAYPHPPTGYPERFFDLIVGVSVFTHLPEPMQFAWLAELRRITKPEGYLILTTSGEKNYRNLSNELRGVLDEKGFLHRDGDYGQSISLPEFYQNTFHSHAYIRREWSRYFEVVDIQSVRVENDQDAVLLRPLAPVTTPPLRSSS